MAYKSWRDDPGLTSHNVYKKRFAYWPVVSSDGIKIWWDNYYAIYTYWMADHGSKIFHEDSMTHNEFNCYITEAEYLVRKLAESL